LRGEAGEEVRLEPSHPLAASDGFAHARYCSADVPALNCHTNVYLFHDTISWSHSRVFDSGKSSKTIGVFEMKNPDGARNENTEQTQGRCSVCVCVCPKQINYYNHHAPSELEIVIHH